MARKKKYPTNTILERFSSETLSATIDSSEEAKRIIEELEQKEIRYTVGDLPKMENGKVIGCSKHITVLDGRKLRDVLTEK